MPYARCGHSRRPLNLARKSLSPKQPLTRGNDAFRQAHDQIPAGAGRRPEHGARQRQWLRRARAPLVRAPEPGGWGHFLAPGTRGRCRAQGQGGPFQADRAAAEGRGAGRRDHRVARSRQPPESHRQGSGEARRPVHRERTLPARARRRQGRDRTPAQGQRPHAQGARGRDRDGPRRRGSRHPGSGRAARSAQEVHDRPDRAGRDRASSTPSSAATTRFAARSRSCSAGPRTTRC